MQQASNMTTPVKYKFKIDPFHNCEGCRTAKPHEGEGDGEVTIITSYPFEVIKYALKRTFPKKQITLLQESPHVQPPSTLANPHNLIADQNSVSLTNTTRSNVIDSGSQPSTSVDNSHQKQSTNSGKSKSCGHQREYSIGKSRGKTHSGLKLKLKDASIVQQITNTKLTDNDLVAQTRVYPATSTFLPTSTMNTTIVLQIDEFCNCEGCIQKVKKTFYELGGVKLLKMDPEIGKFTISTARQANTIKYALECTFSKKNVVIFENHRQASQPPSIHNHQNVTINNYNHIYQAPTPCTTNVYDVAKALATSHAKGLQSVEITHMKFNFNNYEDRPTRRRSRHAMINNVPRRGNAIHACTTSSDDCHAIYSTSSVSTRRC
ncbi:hypothetical protein LXL04_012340 [Taraxacum kok-saghyz]